MKRVRFAPSPTGSLHVGNALSAVANRRLGDWMLLRIDDTDPARNVPGGEQAIVEDLRWLGLEWDEGPVRQSERQARYREAAAQIARVGAPAALAPALRGARDLAEAREYARAILEPPEAVQVDAQETLERFRDLAALDAKTIVRELKAVGGDLRALRLALTG